MNVHAVALSVTRPAPIAQGLNHTGNTRFGTLTVPSNGNPGIVPPWLTKAVGTDVIGVDPIDPSIPHIM